MAEATDRLAITRADIEQTVPDRFETIVRHVPARLALRGAGRSWTYAELNQQANRIAHAIRIRTPPGSGRIAFLVDQSPEMVIATLAIVKAGKTYVAIHPRTPRQSRRAILIDVGPDLLLTTEALEDEADETASDITDVLVLDRIDESFPTDDPSREAAPWHASTLFYTSGSTGQPKGVVKSHRAVLHRTWLAAQHDAITIGDRQSLLTHCSFSASESDMFGALLQGAAVVTFDIATHTFAEFTSWLETEHISLLHPPALYFRRFLSTLEAGHIFPDVRIVALAGDVVLPADLQKWKEHFTRRCVVLHRFSITETALLTVSRFDHDGDLSGVVLEAGQPVADKTLTLIGPDGAAVTAGETGELVVQSDYLADGYWNRSEETAAAFSLDPCGTGQRIYRTGDLGRFLPDGTFVFLGRRGDQVKIRGYRVEVREIEAALMQLDDVREAVCIPWRDDGEQRLRAFIVWKDGREGSAAAIRARLTASLPEWKIPDDFQTISAIPTTLTGKADRQLLAGLATAPVHPSGEDNLQSTVLGIWCRVLRKPVAPDHAFFEDLGGTSLNALEIVTDIGRVTGRRLPLSLLLELNTPRRMSDYLAAQPDRERTVIALQSGGSLPPLFCVSGKGGSVIAFRPLAEALGADQPFYGITHHGIDPESRPTSLAALAACYADAIRQQQPEGPYYLAGYSAGGLIAFDIARQLARAGHRIAFIGLLDTAATQQRAPRLKRYRKYLPILRRQPVATLHRITRGLHRRALIAAQWMRTGTRPPAPEHEANRYYNSLNLQTSIQPYTGPVTLFLAREGTGSNSALPDAGWTKLCPQGLEIVPIDGEHLSILTSDVDGLAQALSGALTKAHPRAFRVSSDSTGQP